MLLHRSLPNRIMRASAAARAMVGMAAVAACSIPDTIVVSSDASVDQDGTSDAGGDAGGGTGGTPGSGGAAGQPGAGGAGDCPAPSSLQTCSSDSGRTVCVAKMVALDGYEIDVTEVTQRQYRDWLLSGATPGYEPAECLSKASSLPSCLSIGQMTLNLPVTCVDWCDAKAYCRWAGKRLCGRIGGDSNPLGNYNDATASQWYNACSSGDKNAYPYGNEYGGSICNGRENPKTGCPQEICLLRAVGSSCGCASPVQGYGGVYDLAGNAWEWEDSCHNGEDGGDVTCLIRGGDVHANSDQMRCDHRAEGVPTATSVSIGFRCCK